jgi:hypothetical protein
MAIAEPVGEKNGKRLFKLGAEYIDEDELQARVAKVHARENRERELDRELNMILPLEGYDVHAKAVADLRARRIFEPSAEQYLDALVRVTA